MKKSITLISCLFVLIGCKGPAGPQGAPGMNAGKIVDFNGPITSNDQYVTATGLNIERGDVLNVYACTGASNNQCVLVSGNSGAASYRIHESAGVTTVELLNFTLIGNFYYIDTLQQ